MTHEKIHGGNMAGTLEQIRNWEAQIETEGNSYQMNATLRQVANDYQQATTKSLPFGPITSDETMLFALKKAFKEDAEEIRRLKAYKRKVQEFIKTMI